MLPLAVDVRSLDVHARATLPLFERHEARRSRGVIPDVLFSSIAEGISQPPQRVHLRIGVFTAGAPTTRLRRPQSLAIAL